MNKAVLIITLSSLLVFSSCVSSVQVQDAEADLDSTIYIQSLLDKSDTTITIPRGVWYTGPLFIRNKGSENIQTKIVFEPGCTIMAKRGLFKDPAEKLITIESCVNLVLYGYEASLKMRQKDYIGKDYVHGQWRHAIALYTSKKIRIEGFLITESGGDAVYIGQDRGSPVNKDIELIKLDMQNNHRQGVSVISVDGFTMENCTVLGTKGTAPMAGIDFEPNSGLYGFTRCRVSNCSFTANKGPGMLFYFIKLTEKHPPIDIVVENCVSSKNRFALSVIGIPKTLEGSIVFSNTSLQGFKYIQIPKKSKFKVEFR